jgi:hypothetical protein
VSVEDPRFVGFPRTEFPPGLMIPGREKDLATFGENLVLKELSELFYVDSVQLAPPDNEGFDLVVDVNEQFPRGSIRGIKVEVKTSRKNGSPQARKPNHRRLVGETAIEQREREGLVLLFAIDSSATREVNFVAQVLEFYPPSDRI